MNLRRAQVADRTVRLLLVLATAMGAWIVLRPAINSGGVQHSISTAAWCLSAHRFDQAQSAANRVLELSPGSSAAFLLAGYAAAGAADFELSSSLLSRVPSESRHSHLAELGLAKNLLTRGRVEAAEQHYRRVLQQDPYNIEGNRRLGHLLQAEGRVWESVEFLKRLLFRGEFNGNELFMVSSIDRYFRIDRKLQQTLSAEDPGDPLIRMAEVRQHMIESREADVRSVLEDLVRIYPHLAEPVARLGRLIVDGGNQEEFLRWNDQLTREHEEHPEIWFIRGLYARREGQLTTAVRCFLEALVRSPHHAGANYQVSGCLLQLEQPQRAAEFSALPPILFRLDRELNQVQGTPNSENAQRVVRSLQTLGRHWEAAGWAYIAKQFPGAEEWCVAVIETEMRKVSASEGLIARDAQPALRLDISEYPLPKWSRASEFSSGEQLPPRSGHFSDWQFSEESNSAGIEFSYFDGTTRRDRMRHVIETLGGGSGVIDFDADGWPDLYVAQGNSWRQPGAGSSPLDRLYRNTGRGRFADVTASCGICEGQMSHGVAVGDYDSDGFADLHITNLGPNSMFHNNGDGTFADISASSGTAGDEWSTSSAIVDLSGDGLPDVFVVNYLDRDFVVQNPCHRNGFEIGCAPDSLPPARNKFYLNSGNGQFEDISDSAGVSSEAGNGLGLIVADFHNEQRLGVFVGNDSTPNFLFRNPHPTGNSRFQLQQQGLEAGVALNGNGSPIASMGIAAGDANGDGLLDLFVTTYMNDPDTLFVQQEHGSFLDQTRRARLPLPTAPVLGFGTQFLDVDNDGWEDLVATNGHVIPPPPGEPDDERDLMPTQVLANLGDETFLEVPAETLGPFFAFAGLGRGLVECDWNRDGRQDFCVTSIHAPLALLSNQTPEKKHRLVIRLIGTRTSRDAFGTVATVKAAGRKLMRQLTAGSGYLVSNERHLWFGLGQSPMIDELELAWPSGLVQRFEKLEADQEILIVEDRDAPIILERFPTP